MLNRYIINSIINVDGYERCVEVENIGSKERFIIHFLEYNEYLESNENSKLKRIGDILEGDLSFGLVVKCEARNGILRHKQIYSSSRIEAIVRVSKVIDEYSIWVESSISGEEILVEFEDKNRVNVGDKIYIEGSLEFHEKENK